ATCHDREGETDARRRCRCDGQRGARDLQPAGPGAGRPARDQAIAAGGMMARLLKQSQAKRLGLPGRTSLEPVSGAIGSKLTFRIAEIAVPRPGDPARGPHLHDGFEECIYVLKGTGVTVAESGEIPIGAWDNVLMPPNGKHL